MTCAPEKLDAYIDGELSPAEFSAVEAHLQACHACSTDALARLQLKRSIRAAAREFQPSAEFRARISGQIAARRKPMRFLPSPALLGAIAAVLVVAVSIPMVARYSAREHAVSEFLDLHVATLASVNPVDVVSTDRHTVKPWFQGKLPFTFNLPELGNSPYTLAGGKLIYFDHAPGAQLLFSLRQHRLSVFVTQGAGPGLARMQTAKGFSVELWSAAGLRWVIVSDASPTDVHALGDLLRSAQAP